MRLLLFLIIVAYHIIGLGIWLHVTKGSKKSTAALLYLMLLWPFLQTGIFKRKK